MIRIDFMSFGFISLSDLKEIMSDDSMKISLKMVKYEVDIPVTLTLHHKLKSKNNVIIKVRLKNSIVFCHK